MPTRREKHEDVLTTIRKQNKIATVRYNPVTGKDEVVGAAKTRRGPTAATKATRKVNKMKNQAARRRRAQAAARKKNPGR